MKAKVKEKTVKKVVLEMSVEEAKLLYAFIDNTPTEYMKVDLGFSREEADKINSFMDALGEVPNICF